MGQPGESRKRGCEDYLHSARLPILRPGQGGQPGQAQGPVRQRGDLRAQWHGVDLAGHLLHVGRQFGPCGRRRRRAGRQRQGRGISTSAPPVRHRRRGPRQGGQWRDRYCAAAPQAFRLASAPAAQPARACFRRGCLGTKEADGLALPSSVPKYPGGSGAAPPTRRKTCGASRAIASPLGVRAEGLWST